MADNVGYTPGTGATVAADEIGGILYQRVKVTAGADGTATDMPGDGTNGLDVDVTRLPALATGSNAIGKLAANSGVDIGDVDVTSLPAPHVTGATALSIAAAYTSTQTSTNLLAGTGGQRIYVTSITIATGGTTAGRVSIYWGTSTFTAGTSVTLFDGEFVPSSTTKPGAILTFPIPPGGASATGDNLRITTSAAMTLYVSGQAYKV